MRVFCVWITALVLVPVAAGANVATPKMEQVATWAAGHPVTVWCEDDDATWAAMTAQAGVPGMGGYTYFAQPVIYLGPIACATLQTTGSLAVGLNMLLHEAAHQRGFHDEALAECAARLLMYSALHDFYGVPWFSKRMRYYESTTLHMSYAKPAAYQNGCDRL